MIIHFILSNSHYSAVQPPVLYRYQGDMNRAMRDQAIRIFMSKDKARVMLMSLKCGGKLFSSLKCTLEVNTPKALVLTLLVLIMSSHLISAGLRQLKRNPSTGVSQIKLPKVKLANAWIIGSIDWVKLALLKFNALSSLIPSKIEC